MQGIKSPELLAGMNLAGYKKRLAIAIKSLTEESKVAQTGGKETPKRSFAILPAFVFEDGESRQVIIIDLTTKWVQYVKKMRKAKEEFVMGECSVEGENVFFDVKRKIRLTKTDILRENKRLRYNAVFENSGLEFSLKESDVVDEELDSGTPDESFTSLLNLISQYKLIDEEKEDLQIAKLKEISQAISEWNSVNKNPSTEQKERLGVIERNVEKNTRLIEKELADEAWADYKHFQENENSFPSSEINEEISELVELYNKWENLFLDDPSASEKVRMADLKLKIQEEREQYAELLEEEKNQNTIFEESGSSLSDIKNLLEQFKKTDPSDLGKRVKGIEGLLKAIESWAQSNPQAPEKPKTQMKSLKEKLEQELQKVRDKENGLVEMAVKDFDDFQSRLKENLDNLPELEEELDESRKLFNDWKLVFEKYGSEENQIRMTLLESDIQTELEDFEKLKQHVESVDSLLEKFSKENSNDKQFEELDKIEKLISSFPE